MKSIVFRKSHQAGFARLAVSLRTCFSVFFAALLLCGIIFPATPHTAAADVRRTDVVFGQSVEERGISATLCPSIDAAYAMVVDGNGTVYYERDALSATQIASVTKIMTAVAALDIAEEYASLDTLITVSARAAQVGESTAQLFEGDILTVESALKALMIPSGNDAAVALAENLGRYLVGDQADDDSSLNAFIAKMNEKATDLGCTDTLFENPHGLDSGTYAGDQHSTASDVAKICLCAMQNETFREIVNTKQCVITVTRAQAPVDITLDSTDELLGVYDGICGIKTGYTTLAGSCFAGACLRNDNYLYVIVLNSSSDSQRFVDAQVLLDWVYGNVITYPLAHSDDYTTMTYADTERDVPVVAEVSHSDWLDKTVKVTLSDPEAYVNVFTLRGNISQSFEFNDVKGDVKEGDVLGCVRFYQSNEEIASQELIAAEDVDAPDTFESIGIWWNRLIGGIAGDKQQADSVIINDTPLIYSK